jgi:hypothetical protein
MLYPKTLRRRTISNRKLHSWVASCDIKILQHLVHRVLADSPPPPKAQRRQVEII